MSPHTFKVLVVSTNKRLQSVIPVLLARHDALIYQGSVSTAGEALALTLADAPDVIVCDSPPSGALEIFTWRAIRESGPRVIILTRYLQAGDDVRSTLAGAAGQILVPERRLTESILRVAGGELLRSEDLAGRLRAIATGEAPSLLNGPERRVLGLVADGEPDESIAIHLGVSQADVREYIAAITEKLG